MNRGLVLKELYSIRRYAKQMIIFVGGFGVLSVAGGSDMMVTYVNTMIMVLGMTVTMNSMAEDEKYNWDVYGLTLPVSRAEVVRVKYLIMVGYIAVSSVFMLVLHVVMYIIHGTDITAAIASTGVIMMVVILAQSLLIPIAVKKGSVKARIYMFVVMGIPLVAIVAVTTFIDIEKIRGTLPSEEVLTRLLQIGKFVVPVIVLVILYISYRVSVSIFNKKEF